MELLLEKLTGQYFVFVSTFKIIIWSSLVFPTTIAFNLE
jgi:hypothetical protein